MEESSIGGALVVAVSSMEALVALTGMGWTLSNERMTSKGALVVTVCLCDQLMR